MEKKTNKEKLEIFKFLRKLAESQGYSLEFISAMIFACRIHRAKSYGFHENAKIIENHSFLLIV